MKRPTDVDMFMALEMIAAAWVATSPAVITNCFTHAGLVTQQASYADRAEPEEGSPVGALEDSTVDSAVPPSLTSACGELCETANEIPDGLSIDEFICADEDVIVHEEMTDEAIVSSVCKAGNPKAGDPDDPRPEQPEKRTTPRMALNALDTIRSFFGEHDDDPEPESCKREHPSSPSKPPATRPTSRNARATYRERDYDVVLVRHGSVICDEVQQALHSRQYAPTLTAMPAEVDPVPVTTDTPRRTYAETVGSSMPVSRPAVPFQAIPAVTIQSAHAGKRAYA
ncbi:hypothetical protein HPB50_016408 [Hyalomma asiaticum]|uniref:Uncharacterized protein n=1 Tax=Hyalomma asiaticum TaxID=266040 RepID=A0ACB7TIW0_HYAAI|nr:hypothetical protein HPB50_016408 [Hyalomma asiaticum]